MKLFLRGDLITPKAGFTAKMGSSFIGTATTGSSILNIGIN